MGRAARRVFSFRQDWRPTNRGNIYVADSGNQTVRKITPAGVVSTIAGSMQSFGSTDGTGSAARFYSPLAVAVGPAGDIYVADTGNHTLRKITPAGTVTTYAGRAGAAGSRDGTREAALFNQPHDIAVDGAGTVYVVDTSNHTIRRITASGEVTTLAGGAGQPGSANGAGEQARFNSPSGVALDSAGNLFVSDTGNHLLRKISLSGLVTTVAGMAGIGGSADGSGGGARFNAPARAVVDHSGTIYVADRRNMTIRRVTASGDVATIAGVAGSAGTEDGPAASARFRSPAGITLNSAGEVIISDASSNTIRKLVADNVSTFAGLAGGSAGSADGPAPSARFNNPSGLVRDPAGNLYVADAANDAIRKISAAGTVSTIAGRAGFGGSADGIGSNATATRATTHCGKSLPQGLSRQLPDRWAFEARRTAWAPRRDLHICWGSQRTTRATFM